jgi:hypothetical protein
MAYFRLGNKIGWLAVLQVSRLRSGEVNEGARDAET